MYSCVSIDFSKCSKVWNKIGDGLKTHKYFHFTQKFIFHGRQILKQAGANSSVASNLVLVLLLTHHEYFNDDFSGDGKYKWNSESNSMPCSPGRYASFQKNEYFFEWISRNLFWMNNFWIEWDPLTKKWIFFWINFFQNILNEWLNEYKSKFTNWMNQNRKSGKFDFLHINDRKMWKLDTFDQNRAPFGSYMVIRVPRVPK